MYITWDKSLSIGVEDLDNDHKKLIAILDELFSSSLLGAEMQALVDILARLIEYTRYHFEREEALLEECGYPDLEVHRREHHRLIGQIERLQESLRAETSASIANDTMRFLNNWLTDHIQKCDMKYTAFLNSQGVR